MAEKSARRQALERGLEDDPRDPFLCYALAIECLRDGALDEGRRRLRAVIAEFPSEAVAAYHQLGRSYVETGEPDEARAVLKAGVQAALARGDRHAADEMDGLLALVDVE